MSDFSKANLPPRTLAIFAKYPSPGGVKSRLAEKSSPQWAADIARVFLCDLLGRFQDLEARRLVLFSPEERARSFQTLVGEHYQLVPQGPGDLGHRLAKFLQAEFSTGVNRIVLLGMDSPTLPRLFVEQAFDLLESADVVLGPATDGGYYLIGCNAYYPRLFQQIDWGGERVLFATVERIRETNLNLALLPPWYDVDTLEDWWMFRGHLAAMHQAGLEVDLPNTEGLLRNATPPG